MKSTYNPKEFEKKWQDKWFENPFYESKDYDSKQKYYLLLEFPYPSGDSMHIGHTRNDSMMDSVARLRRMMGYNVMFPIGWDAFGLPTENYAIKVKRPPQERENMICGTWVCNIYYIEYKKMNKVGGPDGIRTRDPIAASDVLKPTKLQAQIYNEWTQPESNRRSSQCECDVLPAEL